MNADTAQATDTAQTALPILISDGQGREQFRMSRVQVLNWGAYSGLQTMAVSRSGTAIVGPSGRGKSTLLDAMAAVILPNPQEFNQAARDDRGRKRERTVYSYARGQTDQRQDENRRSATTNYLRPPGGPGFPSGAAITWETEDRRRVTVFRLAWVGSDVDGPEAITQATVYGFVHGRFDLSQLNGVTAVRAGTSPLARSSLERFVDLERGDLVDASQARVHAKMRSVMGMGSTDESQRLAMLLLRRAQASKGIFSINELFKEFVLTEPLALARWEIALEAYREASRLYEEFEAARRRTETLEPLPALAERYRAAGDDYVAKRRLLAAEEGGVPRVRVWHSERVAGWAEDEAERVRAEKTAVEAELGEAKASADAAERAEHDTVAQITSVGGDRSGEIRARLEFAEEQLDRVAAERRRFAGRLSAFGLPLPASAGEVPALLEDLEARERRERAELREVDEASNQRQARLWNVKDEVGSKTAELQGLRARRSLIPEDADERRNRIADELGIDPERVRYAGELLQLRSGERRWEKAVVGVLLPLASTLLVDAYDFAAVRRYVHDHDMRGSLTIVPADAEAPAPGIEPGTVPALLEIADHPFGGWLTRELTETANYLCVDSERDLDRALPRGVRGAITPAGMRTGSRNRFTKDDRRPRYPWIGWDNRRLQQELEEELGSLQREAQLAASAADEASERREAVRGRADELLALRTELAWERIDDSGVRAEIEQLNDRLAQVNAPEVAQLTELLQHRRAETVDAMSRVQRLQSKRDDLATWWGDLVTVVDEAKNVVDAEPALTGEERFALAELPFAEPNDVGGVAASLRTALADLAGQIERHRSERDSTEQAILGHIAAYRNLDERTERETDGAIDSLPAVLAVYEQLVADDLPRAKAAWLAKIDEDLNSQLRGVLVQIDDDARSIRRGLGPINEVLRNVRFRQDSTLGIEPVERVSSDLREFRRVVAQYTSNTLGMDGEREAEQVERSFAGLRKQLAGLDDLSRSGDAWRRRVFDAREHVEFQAIETRADGVKVVHDGVSGMSGGEGQELIAFILGAALRFRLGEGHDGPPRYASIILDEGFVKADSEFTGRALSALRALGFQVVVGAPREKATAFEHYVESVAYINLDADRPSQVRIYPMTMQQALRFEEEPRVE